MFRWLKPNYEEQIAGLKAKLGVYENASKNLREFPAYYIFYIADLQEQIAILEERVKQSDKTNTTE